MSNYKSNQKKTNMMNGKASNTMSKSKQNSQSCEYNDSKAMDKDCGCYTKKSKNNK